MLLVGVPGGVNLSVKRGNVGFIVKNMAAKAVIVWSITSIRKLTSLESETLSSPLLVFSLVVLVLVVTHAKKTLSSMFYEIS